MSTMKPGSGGPYARLAELRFRVKQLKQVLAHAPLGHRKRRKQERNLKALQMELTEANASVRALKRT